MEGESAEEAVVGGRRGGGGGGADPEPAESGGKEGAVGATGLWRGDVEASAATLKANDATVAGGAEAGAVAAEGAAGVAEVGSVELVDEDVPTGRHNCSGGGGWGNGSMGREVDGERGTPTPEPLETPAPVGE